MCCRWYGLDDSVIRESNRYMMIMMMMMMMMMMMIGHSLVRPHTRGVARRDESRHARCGPRPHAQHHRRGHGGQDRRVRGPRLLELEGPGRSDLGQGRISVNLCYYFLIGQNSRTSSSAGAAPRLVPSRPSTPASTSPPTSSMTTSQSSI